MLKGIVGDYDTMSFSSERSNFAFHGISFSTPGNELGYLQNEITARHSEHFLPLTSIAISTKLTGVWVGTKPRFPKSLILHSA